MSTDTKKIIALSGSIRKDSSNSAILKYLAQQNTDRFEVFHWEQLEQLPFFHPDQTYNLPPIVKEFLGALEKADGVWICSPEYVFSIPGILKNALEWTVATTVFLEKPTLLITASSSGKNAHDSLSLVIKTLGARLENSTLLVSNVKTKVDSSGNLISEELRSDLKKIIEAFDQYFP
jgi:NAD(P)H-dependent FMN reductase